MKQKIPREFQPLLWSYDFSSINPETYKQRIIINTVNYGKWRHWKWMVKEYGREEIKRILEETPKTEFRLPALKLISLLLGVENFKYASRSAKLRSS